MTLSATPSDLLASRDARDLAAIRAEFPLLAREIGGQPVAYLDSAATAQKPRAVLAAMARFLEESNGAVSRGVHRLSGEATAAYEAARERVAAFLGGSAGEIVFTRGTTEAINLVAASFVRPRLGAGDEIVVSELEHHSNFVPWQQVCSERGARLVVVPVSDRGEVTADEVAAHLTPRTKLVALAHISNTLGTVLPIAGVAGIAARCRAHGVPLLVDGAQSTPHRPIDVAALGCDFFAFSGHKLYGPTGIGALWAKRAHLEAMPPWQSGGGMIETVAVEGTTFAPPPARFEAGTPAAAEAVGLAAAIDFLASFDRAAVAAHEEALLARAIAGLAAIPGLRILGAPAERSAVVSFVVDGVHAHDLGTVLDQRGVAVRAGHHCTQPLHRRLAIAASVRASIALHTTEEEIDRLVSGVAAAVEMFA
ncbi:MAG: aminotransferase class V-fold PLP-dependent enzyme [Thermoanaerobaculia bacterium]